MLVGLWDGVKNYPPRSADDTRADCRTARRLALPRVAPAWWTTTAMSHDAEDSEKAEEAFRRIAAELNQHEGVFRDMKNGMRERAGRNARELKMTCNTRTPSYMPS